MLLPIVYSFDDMADVIAIIVADVIATLFLYCVGWCYCQLYVADVIATEADVIAYHNLFGWCYCQLCVADVIATEADVIAYHNCVWLMLLPK